MTLSGSRPPRYDAGSFRDPHSRVWHDDDRVLRGLDKVAEADFTALQATGFFRKFCGSGKIVDTRVAHAAVPDPDGGVWGSVLEHAPIPVITYVHEWSFSMLRDAASLVLRLVRAAIDEGMTTKDATPYNVQFVGVNPVFIDVASFEPHRPGEPWWGYRQFCQMFLYPLMFAAYKSLPHQPWMRGAVDGITPQQALRVLQGRRHGSRGMMTHVWLQAKAARRFTGGSDVMMSHLEQAGYNDKIYIAMVDRLKKLVDGLRCKHKQSHWRAYSQRGHYTQAGLRVKADFVRRAAARRRWSQVWDVGANDGVYSRIVAEHADAVIAMDADSCVVDRLYADLREEGTQNIVPLVVDFADPTPGIGWRGLERPALHKRSTPDLVLALAVIHHLTITRNVPAGMVLAFLADLGAEMVLEIPSERDRMVKRLMAHKRVGVHSDYTVSSIETQARQRFDVLSREELPGGTRVMLHLTPRG